MIEYTERVQQGASEASPPACNYYYVEGQYQSIEHNTMQFAHYIHYHLTQALEQKLHCEGELENSLG